MNSTERVLRTLRGEETDRQPIYGWVKENLNAEISEIFGSVENFEDRYEFDAAMVHSVQPASSSIWRAQRLR